MVILATANLVYSHSINIRGHTDTSARNTELLRKNAQDEAPTGISARESGKQLSDEGVEPDEELTVIDRRGATESVEPDESLTVIDRRSDIKPVELDESLTVIDRQSLADADGSSEDSVVLI